jgi:hypothetical protein
MPHRPIAVAAALTAALITVLGRREHQLRRALHAERAARRITEACLVRDITAFERRLRRLMADRTPATDALDAALATQSPDDPHTEGGPA